MNYVIKTEGDHYVMFVDGSFYGSYDTVAEAARDIDILVAEKFGPLTA